MGPDYDIGNSPILMTLPNGKRALLAGTKGADVFALDPDNNGAVLFRVNPSGQPVGFTGRGARRDRVGRRRRPAARVLRHGRRGTWRGPASRRQDGVDVHRPGRRRPRSGRLGAAPTAIPGVVFQGAADGRLFAVSAADGKQLWEFNTAQDFETVNKVPAHGGAIATVGRGGRGRHGLRRLRVRDQQRRVRRQRAAGVWCRVELAPHGLDRPSLLTVRVVEQCDLRAEHHRWPGCRLVWSP